MRIWDVSDLSNITQVAEYESRDQLIIHNVTVREDYAYISYYIDGLRVVDLSDPTNPGEVGFYDTFPAESRNPFDGDWGVYPFAPSGNIYVSDLSTGLYILDFNEGVRSGGVSGVITDKSTGMPIAAAEVNFAEAGKTFTSDVAGVYAIRTNEGHHTVTATAFGFLPETAGVDVVAGPGAAELNISLEVNTAALDVSEKSLKLELETGEIGQKALIISNVGGGILNFEIDDIAGPFENGSNSRAFSEDLSFQLSWDISKIKSAVAKGFASRKETTETARMSHLSRNLMLPSSDLEEIISDPVGDLLGDPAFTKPDIVGLFADFDDVAVTFQFVLNEDIDLSSTVILLSLDTDQDIETGAFPPASGIGAPNTSAHDIGSEFELIWDVSDIFGTGGGILMLTFDGNFVGIVPMQVDLNTVTASIPLDLLGNDDGNMNVTCLAQTFPGAPAIDFAPNEGHGTVGLDVGADVPWLSVFPTSGSLQGGESQEIMVNFDASGLAAGTTLEAEILVEVFGVAIAPLVVSVELTTTQPTEEITITFGDGPKVDFSGVASDAYLDRHKDDFNTGTTHFLRVGNDGLPDKRPNRSLIKFDFTPGLMVAGVTDSDQILDAWIDLRVFSSEGAGEDGLFVDIFKVNKDWNEGATDYAHAAMGEVTWNAAKHNEKKWSTTGAGHVSKDREKKPDDTEHIESPGRARFNVKSTIKDMFESGNNFGWLLQARDESKDKYYRIYSSEHRKTKRRPKLTIVARVPDNNMSESSEIDRVELRAVNSPHPESFGMEQNYPNPFNPETVISFRLPNDSHVVVKIFNMLGQEIRTLVEEQKQAGSHSVVWDGKDDSGRQASSGVYVYKIMAADPAADSGQAFVTARKMILLR